MACSDFWKCKNYNKKFVLSAKIKKCGQKDLKIKECRHRKYVDIPFFICKNIEEWRKKIIKINKTVYSKNKDEKGRWFLGTTKTSGSCREVFICDTLYRILVHYKEIQSSFKKKYGNKYKKYELEAIKNKHGKVKEYKIVEIVFTKNNGLYVGTDIIKYPFKIIHNELGLRKCRFYDLRGSYATKTLRNGAEIKDIAEILGHSRIETTKNYYILSSDENKKEANNLLEKIIYGYK